MEEFYNDGKIKISALGLEEYISYMEKISEFELPKNAYVCYTQSEDSAAYSKKVFLELSLAKQWVKEEYRIIEQERDDFYNSSKGERLKYLNDIEILYGELTAEQEKELDKLDDIASTIERKYSNTLFWYHTVPLGGQNPSV